MMKKMDPRNQHLPKSFQDIENLVDDLITQKVNLIDNHHI